MRFLGCDRPVHPLDCLTMIRAIALFLLFILALVSPGGAAQLRVLAWDDAVAARRLALVSGDDAREITGMHPLKRTAAIRLKGEAPFAIRVLDGKPGPDGKPLERAFGIAENVKSPLLVILPDESHPTGVRLLVVDDNQEGFKWGAYRFINATPRALVVQMEKTARRVPPGWKPVDIDLGGETRGVGARISLSDKIEEPLYSAVWEYNTDVRTLCFLVPGTDTRTSPVDFKAIPEDKVAYKLQTAEPDADGKSPR